MDFDLVMISTKTDYLLHAVQFPRVRLLQVTGFTGVKAVTPVYTELAEWRNPLDPGNTREIFVMGFDPTDAGFDTILNPMQRDTIKLPDRVLFDALSRSEYGPIPALIAEHEELALEIGGRSIRVAGLFHVGTSFGIDGALVTSDLNLQRLFPERASSHLSLGLIHLDGTNDAKPLLATLRRDLPDDVLILTPEEFTAREVDYWNNTTPIGYVFTFGVIMGFVVGMIIVYQILYSDVQDHLQEYATLKAMGYSNNYLGTVVLQEASILAILGFVPGSILTYFLFVQASGATNLPLALTFELGAGVLVLTLLMCIASGIIAVRKLRSADPADVF